MADGTIGLTESEAVFWKWAKAHGWNVHRGGWPDFLCVLPNSQVLVVEVKKEGYRLTHEQRMCLHILNSAGVPSYIWTAGKLQLVGKVGQQPITPDVAKVATEAYAEGFQKGRDSARREILQTAADLGKQTAAGIAARRTRVKAEGKEWLWGRARTGVMTKNPSLPRKAVELRQQGRSWRQISEELGVGRSTARKYVLLAAKAASDVP